MKKFIALLLTVVICFTSFAAFAAGDNIKVYLDGKQLTFDVEPQLISDRVMVPVRAIFEGLGANVQWNEENQKVVSSKENIIVTLTIGSYIMQVVDVSKGTEKEVMLDVAPVEINGRTLIPARFVAEAFGCDVQWDDSTQSVFISTDPSNPYIVAPSSSNPSSSESISKTGMSTEDFDKGMAKGIEAFDQGRNYKAKNLFQWFCDQNWEKMNDGQRDYALDYLNSATQNFDKWSSEHIGPYAAFNAIKSFIVAHGEKDAMLYTFYLGDIHFAYNEMTGAISTSSSDSSFPSTKVYSSRNDRCGIFIYPDIAEAEYCTVLMKIYSYSSCAISTFDVKYSASSFDSTGWTLDNSTLEDKGLGSAAVRPEAEIKNDMNSYLAKVNTEMQLCFGVSLDYLGFTSFK